jgi:hypothetical protein
VHGGGELWHERGGKEGGVGCGAVRRSWGRLNFIVAWSPPSHSAPIKGGTIDGGARRLPKEGEVEAANKGGVRGEGMAG